MMKKFDHEIFCERAYSLFRYEKQDSVAKKLDVKQGYISDIKNKKAKEPSFDLIFKIAEKYQVSTDWLLGFDYDNIKTSDKDKASICKKMRISDVTYDILTGKNGKSCQRVLHFLSSQHKLFQIWGRLAFSDKKDLTKEAKNLLEDERFKTSLLLALDLFVDAYNNDTDIGIGIIGNEIMINEHNNKMQNVSVDRKETVSSIRQSANALIMLESMLNIQNVLHEFIERTKFDALRKNNFDEKLVAKDLERAIKKGNQTNDTSSET